MLGRKGFWDDVARSKTVSKLISDVCRGLRKRPRGGLMCRRHTACLAYGDKKPHIPTVAVQFQSSRPCVTKAFSFRLLLCKEGKDVLVAVLFSKAEVNECKKKKKN